MRPTVSVIIPVYNDPRGILETLGSLPLDRPDCEVVVVDNGSTDYTPTVVAECVADVETVSLFVEDRIQSSYAARNKGIEHARGDIFAFIDANMTVPADWIDRAVAEFRQSGADYMGCNVELVLPDDPSIAARYDDHTGFPVEQYLEYQRFVPTCCLVVHREIIEAVGLFNHRLISGGDKEFGNRVHDAGYETHFAASVTMYHPARNTLSALVRKDRRVGRGLCQLQRYHPDRYGQLGLPPRPSGIKSPDHSVSTGYHVVFGVLSMFLTGIRGLGYYEECLTGEGSEHDDGFRRLKT